MAIVSIGHHQAILWIYSNQDVPSFIFVVSILKMVELSFFLISAYETVLEMDIIIP